MSGNAFRRVRRYGARNSLLAEYRQMAGRISRISRIALFVLFPALLSACGGPDEELVDAADGDGLEASALGSQIMVDPDLAGQNLANSAISAELGDGMLPPERSSPEAIAAARADALAQLGGPGSIRKAPAASGSSNTGAAQALTAAGKAAASPGGKGDCAALASYTADWAAKLPASFPVYPLGAVQEAAGTDEGGCSLRVVTYLTAVPLGDVLDYYYTRASKAGFSADHAMDGEYHLLGGAKGKASFIVYGRALPTSATEITLVTSGS
jgi:hypothetical protein